MLVDTGTYLNLNPTLQVDRSWFEIKTVTDSRGSVNPVTAVAFDPVEELTWTGLENVSNDALYFTISMLINTL